MRHWLLALLFVLVVLPVRSQPGPTRHVDVIPVIEEPVDGVTECDPAKDYKTIVLETNTTWYCDFTTGSPYYWTEVAPSGGDVTSSESSGIDESITCFDGATGKVIQECGDTVTESPTVNSATGNTTILGLFWTKTGPVFDVRAWGALGDGSTDDSAAIQAAIDAADTAGGGVVYFGPSASSYKFASTLNIADYITLQGQGPQSTIIAYTGSGTAISQKTPGTRIHRVGIRDLYLNDAGTGTKGWDLDCVSNSNFTNSVIAGFDTGVHIHCVTTGGSVYNNFSDVVMAGGATTLFIDGVQSNENHFDGCKFSAATSYGVRIVDANHNTFDGCSMEGPSGADTAIGISIEGDVAYFSKNNVFYSPRLEEWNTPFSVSTYVVNATIDSPHLSGNANTIDSADSGDNTQIRHFEESGAPARNFHGSVNYLDTLYFGDDANLYRSAVDTLKTDDDFHVAGDLDVTGKIEVGDGTFGADRVALRQDLGPNGFDPQYIQFYDQSRNVNLVYATAANGYEVRTHGELEGGSEGYLMIALKARTPGVPALITFGPAGTTTSVQMNGNFLSDGEATLFGGYRKAEAQVVASTTQTRIAATKCIAPGNDAAPANICEITTVGTAGDSVGLPGILNGRNQCWYNETGTTAWLWPDGALDDLGNGAGNKMDVVNDARVCCETAGGSRWWCVSTGI